MTRYYAVNMSTLQKAISCSLRNELRNKGKINLGKRTSFTHKVTYRHREFGDCVLTIDRSKICKRYQCIDVEYTIDFLKAHPDFYGILASKNYKDLMKNMKEKFHESTGEKWNGTDYELECFADDEFENLYGWEDEVVVKGNPVIIKEDDVISVSSFASV